jgi:hypothetical protein
MMVKMSTERLNELLKRAVESLQDDRATLITFVDPTKPLLPESYWRDQLDRAGVVRHNAAAEAAADLFERSLEIARIKMRRRAEDERLANASVDELLDDVPTLWQPNELTTWGTMPMARSGGRSAPPTQGPQAPSYDYECYQCGRPITDRGQNHWVDHGGKDLCDHALMLDWVDMDDIPTWHQPKPFHGEEEDDEGTEW